MLQKIKQSVKLSKENDYSISLKHHIIFWTVYFLFTTFRWGSYFNDYIYAFKTTLLGFIIHMTLCYFNVYYLMPKLLYKKRYILYTATVIASLFIMVIAKFNLTYFLVSNNVWPEGPEPTSTLTFNYVIEMMLGELYVMTFVTAIKVTLDWIKEHKRLVDLEKLQLETELRFLRTQVSPHFFFNTLNNIYALSIEKSDKTPKTILKLSELMRYLLYETKQRRQSLSKEIICLQNYLDLERIRYGNKLTINMNVSGDIDNKNIAPMLLLSFVENSFKHGANKSVEDFYIDIDFTVEDSFLNFSVSNPIPKKNNNNTLENKMGGIGIENVRKRLALGYQEDAYELNIDQTEDNFTASLKIKLE